MSPADRELARHWREWADDTGQHVVHAAELSAQGIGAHTPDMRTLLSFAFMAGWHAHDVRIAFDAADSDKAKVRQAVRTAIDVLQEVAK